LVDEVEQVSNDDCMEMVQKLMKEEGILAGISSGAAVVAAKRFAERPENKDKIVVVLLASGTERYLSSPLFAGQFSELEEVQ
ncbi:MAG: pyridoxal-phosphate dependent enzyme, partial [Glaciecola sp.]